MQMDSNDTKAEDRAEGQARGASAGAGALKQFFGCVLLSLGLLNTMLAFKAGLGQDFFNFLLIFSGVLIIAMGVWGHGGKEVRASGSRGSKNS
jgi:hypothetical protein